MNGDANSLPEAPSFRVGRPQFTVRLDGQDLPLNPMTNDYMDRWEVTDGRL